MANTYKLIWSDEALKNLKNILAYLEENWTHKEINKFALLLDHQLNLISNQPFLFPKSEKSKGLRKSVLTKQTTIYYRLKGYEIQIMSLFDNRQDPNKMSKHQ